MLYLIFAILGLLFSVVRPGTQIIQRTTPPPRQPPTDTSVWFVTGLTDRGPLTAQFVASMADFERIFGLRQTYSILYDALDVAFREGLSGAYVARVVGPAAVLGTKNLLDAVAAISLTATAIGPGAWINTYKIGVRAGVGSGTFQVYTQDVNSVEVESSPDLTTQSDAVQWSQGSSFFRLTLGVSALVPAVVAPAVFTGGNDDRSNVTETQWTAALTSFTTDLGPGQVSAPGRSTDAAHQALLAHAQGNGRVALCDLPDSSAQATLTASVAAARVGNQRFGASFAPWVICPGFVVNTLRTVPPSALIAGLLGRNDGVYGPNQAAAGVLGEANYAIALSQANFTDSVRNTLNSTGVNVIRLMFGGVRVYGWRSMVDPVQDPNWIDFGNSRLYMAIYAKALAIAETYILRQIDGAGMTINAFNGDLAGMLQLFYNEGALYGLTPGDAFRVDTGPSVNTPTTIANNELHAVLSVRMSPQAELVTIEIVKVAPSQAV